MRSTFSLALVLAFAARYGLAAAVSTAYLACVNAVPSTASLQFMSGSASACATACAGLGTSYLYSFWAGGQGNGCYCGTSEPPISTFVDGTDDAGTCSSPAYTSWITYSSYVFNQCWGSYSNLDNSQVFKSATTVEQCLGACASYSKAYFRIVNSALECSCGNNLNGYSDTACAGVALHYFSHTAGANASPWAKRQLRDRLDSAKRAEEQKLCPGQLSACAVPEAGGYECIDTSSELESCGGCLNGYATANGTIVADTKAVNCESLPGVASGATTCSMGQCMIESCLSGFSLKDNQCLRQVGTSRVGATLHAAEKLLFQS